MTAGERARAPGPPEQYAVDDPAVQAVVASAPALDDELLDEVRRLLPRVTDPGVPDARVA